MSREPSSSLGTVPRPSLRQVVGVAFRGQTYRNLAYLALAFPLGMAYFTVFVAWFSISGVLSVLVVGVPLFLLGLGVVVLCGRFERSLTETLLGLDIEPPRNPLAESDGVVDGATGLVVSSHVWLVLAYLLAKLFVGVFAFVLLSLLLVTSLVMVATPLFYDATGVQVGLILDEPTTVEPALYVPWDHLLVGVEAVVRVTSWQVTTLTDALVMSAIGVGLLVLSLNVLNAYAWLTGQFARVMLSGNGCPERQERADSGS